MLMLVLMWTDLAMASGVQCLSVSIALSGCSLLAWACNRVGIPVRKSLVRLGFLGRDCSLPVAVMPAGPIYSSRGADLALITHLISAMIHSNKRLGSVSRT